MQNYAEIGITVVCSMVSYRLTLLNVKHWAFAVTLCLSSSGWLKNLWQEMSGGLMEASSVLKNL